jgi:hypothetical protein
MKYEVCSKSSRTFCVMRGYYCTSIPCKLWLVEGSLVCGTGAESLPYLVQSTCCTSLGKHVFVTIGDTSERRV